MVTTRSTAKKKANRTEDDQNESNGTPTNIIPISEKQDLSKDTTPTSSPSRKINFESGIKETGVAEEAECEEKEMNGSPLPFTSSTESITKSESSNETAKTKTPQTETSSSSSLSRQGNPPRTAAPSSPAVQPLSASAPPHSSSLPFTMQLMKPFWAMCCQECGAGSFLPDQQQGGGSQHQQGTENRRDAFRRTVSALNPDPFHVAVSRHGSFADGDSRSGLGGATDDGDYQEEWAEDMISTDESPTKRNGSGGGPQLRLPAVANNTLPMLYPGGIKAPTNTTEKLIHEYISACQLYGISDRINAGVLTTLRFSLPSLRVSGSFHDADMLALTELMLKHCNGAMSYVRRIDLSIASREGKMHGKFGIRSHGAYALSKVLQKSKHVREIFVPHNRIGPYGASALFVAASTNSVLRTLMMRGCRIGQKGAYAFVEHICQSEVCGLKEVDLSANRIGFAGCIAVEEALANRDNKRVIDVDMEANLVFQEIMNTLTHGLGIILSIVGTMLLSRRVRDKPNYYSISCGVYSASLLILYSSSTLYHSFFALRSAKSIFSVLDHCAIYILIAGSYTPFMRIALHANPLWSVYLLAFIWMCCFGGLFVEAFYPTWKYKSKFSLAMYLGMGWCCLICLPDMVEALPSGAIKLLVLGGVGYTSGVPFFVRNNNLDHSIWHMFVLAGSMFHWFGVFLYVATLP